MDGAIMAVQPTTAAAMAVADGGAEASLEEAGDRGAEAPADEPGYGNDLSGAAEIPCVRLKLNVCMAQSKT